MYVLFVVKILGLQILCYICIQVPGDLIFFIMFGPVQVSVLLACHVVDSCSGRRTVSLLDPLF